MKTSPKIHANFLLISHFCLRLIPINIIIFSKKHYNLVLTIVGIILFQSQPLTKPKKVSYATMSKLKRLDTHKSEG